MAVPESMLAISGWLALAAPIVLILTALLLLTIDAIRPDEPSNGLLAGVSATGALIAFSIAVWYLFAGDGVAAGNELTFFRETIVVDGMALFFTAIFGAVAAMVVIASFNYLEDLPNTAEFYSLVLFATTGMSLMAVSNSLATVFVSLELASLPSYALVAFLKSNKGSIEAGTKYFLIGALSSAIFAFGISLVYAATGSLLLSEVAIGLADVGDLAGVAGIGILMILGGFAFKTASVPFHFWAPEAYEGAPAPISAFLSSASKAAGFVVAFRVFVQAFPLETAMAINVNWSLAFAILAVLTMTIGNFAAAVQENVKRMLAYSSIGHAGYALIGLAAITTGSGSAALNGDVMGAAMTHLFVYGFMNTGAFLFIAMVEYWGVGRTFDDYAGLATKAPMASVAMTVFMFSLAGLPPFGGFFSKYFLFAGAIQSGFVYLAAIGAINSALSLYYYSRVVKALWIDDPTGNLDAVGSRPLGIYAAIMFAGVATLLLLPGIGPVIETAQSIAVALFA